MGNKQLKFLMAMLATLALGSILFVACTRPGTPSTGGTASGGGGGSGGGSSSCPSATTVHMGLQTFLQTCITISKGSKLTLIDDVAVPHNILNGSWDGSTQKPAKEAGAPTVSQNFVGSDTHDIGPFTTAGKFHIYCNIHPGMNLMVTIQ